MRLTGTATRLRAPDTVGPDGAAIPGDWARVTDGQLLKADYPAEIQPLVSTEDVVAQQRTESTHVVFLPSDADVVPTDRIRFLGIDYQVDGQPEQWRRGNRIHHLEVLVFRVQGG